MSERQVSSLKSHNHRDLQKNFLSRNEEKVPRTTYSAQVSFIIVTFYLCLAYLLCSNICLLHYSEVSGKNMDQREYTCGSPLPAVNFLGLGIVYTQYMYTVSAYNNIFRKIEK